MMIGFNRLLRSILCIAVICSMAISATGCDAIMEKIAIGKVESMVEESFGGFFESKGKNDLDKYAVTAYDKSEYIDEQLELFRFGLNKAHYELVETTLKDSHEQGKCKIKITKAAKYDDFDLWIGTMDEYKEAVKALGTKAYTITLKVEKTDDDDWKFSDLTPFYDLFLQPMADRCFIDDDGAPINITPKYIESFMVESVWYDPIMSNPLEDDYLVEPKALVNVVYFNRQIDMTLTAKLYRDDDLVTELTCEVNSRNIAEYDFDAVYALGKDHFEAGRYHIKFYVDDRFLVESPDIMVR